MKYFSNAYSFSIQSNYLFFLVVKRPVQAANLLVLKFIKNIITHSFKFKNFDILKKKIITNT